MGSDGPAANRKTTPEPRTAQIEDEDDDENEYDWRSAPNAKPQTPNANR